MPTVPTAHVASLPTPSVPDGLIELTVSHDGVVDALMIDTPLDYRRGTEGLSPKAFADRPNRYRLLCDLTGSPSELHLPELRDNLHHFRRLAGPRWLAVRARCSDRNDRNAIIFDAAGGIAGRFHIGDAVQDVQVTPRGDIWAGYFDEAFCGGTAGEAGLAAFDQSGNCLFDFNARLPAPEAQPSGAESLDSIVDCYAFNAASDREVWVCPYTDFPVIRMIDGRVDRIWSNPRVEGAGAMLGFGDRALFAGSYDDRDSLFLCELGKPKARPRRLRPVDPVGDEIAWVRAFTSGRRMYLETDRDLYRVELHELF